MKKARLVSVMSPSFPTTARVKLNLGLLGEFLNNTVLLFDYVK